MQGQTEQESRWCLQFAKRKEPASLCEPRSRAAPDNQFHSELALEFCSPTPALARPACAISVIYA